MANVVTGNPFVIDTVTSTAIIAAGNYFDIYAIRLVSGSLADTCLVEEADGTDKWASTGSAAGHTDQTQFNPPLQFNGLKVTALDSGRVFIYVNKRLR